MMGAMSIGHWAIVILVVILLFGRNKITHLMEDIGGGLRNLRKGMRELTEEEQEIKRIANEVHINKDV
jgi:sec-independent protein translocase protein TatA